MFRLACWIALGVFAYAMNEALHAIQWVGLPLYLLICGSIVAICYGVARVIDRANNRSQQQVPPTQPYYPPSRNQQRLLGDE